MKSPEPVKEPVHINLSPDSSPEPKSAHFEEKFEGLRLSQTQLQEVGASAVPELVISDVTIVVE